MHGQFAADYGAGFAQAPGIAYDQWAAALVQVLRSQALHDDFRADAGGVPHGDGNNREIHQ
jgi:hypothetical protein